MRHLAPTAVLVVLLTSIARGSDAVEAPRPDTVESESVATTNSAPDAGVADIEYGEPVDSGMVVVRGQPLEGPYRVGYRDREVFINEERITVVRSSGRTSRPPEGRKRTSRSVLAVVASIEKRLFNGDVLLVFNEETRAFVDEDAAVSLLRELVQAKSPEARVRAAMAVGSDSFNDFPENEPITSAQWREALARFEPTDALNEFLSDWEGDETDEDDATGSVLRREGHTSAQRMYVLTVVGMLLVVLSCGVLVSHRPEMTTSWSQVSDSDAQIRMSRQCLLLVVVLSAFDLVCTVLAGTTGQFAELNTLANSLLPTPAALAAFKILATLGGVGILLLLRRYAGAQLASWWMCLLLTVLTVRWIAVQSLLFA